MRLYFEDPAGRRLAIETKRQEYITNENNADAIDSGHTFIQVTEQGFIDLLKELDFNCFGFSGAWLDPDSNKRTEIIKVNLPANKRDYIAGNGEGVFVQVDSKTKADYDSDKAGAGYIGTLDNFSYKYKGLKPGQEIPLELRGKNRPVVPLEWLFEFYGPSENL